MRFFREILPPLVCGYAVFVAMVIVEWRRPVGANVQRGRPRDVVITVAGGYLAFLLIVAVFHVVLAREAGAFLSALVGGGFLLIVACASFALFSWIEAVLRRRRTGRSDLGR
jgi:Family of unknown function (DUF6256)